MKNKIRLLPSSTVPADRDMMLGDLFWIDQVENTANFFLTGGPYSISLKSLDTEGKLLRWAHHMAKKHWMTIEVLRFFIQEVDHHFGFDLDNLWG